MAHGGHVLTRTGLAESISVAPTVEGVMTAEALLLSWGWNPDWRPGR